MNKLQQKLIETNFAFRNSGRLDTPTVTNMLKESLGDSISTDDLEESLKELNVGSEFNSDSMGTRLGVVIELLTELRDNLTFLTTDNIGRVLFDVAELGNTITAKGLKEEVETLMVKHKTEEGK